ncbi:MAG: YbaN family protein [Treponema sp.]|jgi:uncharacterized membrane protein YbaN (DUF454 family)|nr:YbaN family protein [Treponema sp.]
MLFFALGLLCLGLGTVGAFLPVLPTTPFVILAGICFSVSSPKMNAIIQRSKFFGPYIENYRNKTGVPLSAKITSIISMWLLLAISAFFMHKTWSYIVFPLIGSAVTIHILLLKTQRIEQPSNQPKLAK